MNLLRPTDFETLAGLAADYGGAAERASVELRRSPESNKIVRQLTPSTA